MVRAVCAGRRLVELDGPEVGALAAEDRLKSVAVGGDSGSRRRRRAVDHRCRCAAAGHRGAGRRADPLRAAHRGRHRRRRPDRDLRAPRSARCTVARPRAVRPGAGFVAARRRDPKGPAGDVAEVGANRTARTRPNRRSHTRFRRCRFGRTGARSGAAGRVSGQRRRPATEAQPGRSGRRADRHPATVPLGQRGADGRQRDVRRCRGHGRGQTGADRSGAVAVATSRHVRPVGRRSAARRAVVRPTRLRQDLRGPRVGQHWAARACMRSKAPS